MSLFRKLACALAVLTVVAACTASSAWAAGYELLVSSRNSNQVLRFGSDGTSMGVFASGSGMASPMPLAVAPNGKVYVGMTGTPNKVQRWSAGGAFEQEFTDSLLSIPTGLTVDASNNFYVSSYSGDEVVRWDANGSYYGTFASGSGLDSPGGLAFDTQGRLYVPCAVANKLMRFNADGSFESNVVVFENAGTIPSAAAIGSDGDIYVLIAPGKPGNAVIRYTSAGVYKAYYTFADASEPAALALRPGDDRLYITAKEGVFYWDEAKGGQLLIADGKSGLNRAFGIAIRPLQPSSRNTVMYQAKLTNPSGQVVADGQYTLTFKFYTQGATGTPIWTSAPVNVQTKGGFLTTAIKAVPLSVFSATDVWLEVMVGAETIAPRAYIGVVPLAIRATASP